LTVTTAQMKSPQQRSHYELLDIAEDAKREEIALAYQRSLEALARDPDAAFDKKGHLRRAFEVLTDPMQRMTYDLSLRRNAPQITYETLEGDEGSLISRLWGRVWVKALLLVLALLIVTMWMRSGKRDANIGLPPSELVSNTAASNPVAGAPGRSNDSGLQSTAGKPDASGTAAQAGRSAEDVFAKVSASVVRINVADGGGEITSTGSGVVIGSGMVVTNCHVALRGESLEVKVGGGSYSASVDVADEERDLCRLSVSGLSAPSVSIGSIETVRVGQRVYAIGAPQGLDLTISDGIVSALREMQGGRVIQTSAPVSPGSSGGGLFDTSGKLIGIVTFQTRTGQNLNFAVPADWVSEIKNR